MGLEDRFDILGQAVNGIWEYFQTKWSCAARSTWGQKVHFYQKLEIEMSDGVASCTIVIVRSYHFGMTLDLGLTSVDLFWFFIFL